MKHVRHLGTEVKLTVPDTRRKEHEKKVTNKGWQCFIVFHYAAVSSSCNRICGRDSDC